MNLATANMNLATAKKHTQERLPPLSPKNLHSIGYIQDKYALIEIDYFYGKLGRGQAVAGVEKLGKKFAWYGGLLAYGESELGASDDMRQTALDQAKVFASKHKEDGTTVYMRNEAVSLLKVLSMAEKEAAAAAALVYLKAMELRSDSYQTSLAYLGRVFGPKSRQGINFNTYLLQMCGMAAEYNSERAVNPTSKSRPETKHDILQSVPGLIFHSVSQIMRFTGGR